MAQQFLNLKKTAEVLGIAPADVHVLREQNKLRGYRDGADWKFKTDEVQELLAERIKAQHEQSADAVGDDFELNDAAGSDVNLDDKDTEFQVAGSDLNLTEEKEGAVGDDSGLELDLTLDEDLTLDDSNIALASEEGEGSSNVDLAAEGDDDLVLGGSGSGSDITIGGDSGISLVDPQDSGLSLEEPIELAGDEESLELGEDDMLSLAEDVDSESPTELAGGGEDDFLLTPLEEVGDEDSESGSQVIALDTTEGNENATLVGGGVEMPAMLDEDAAPAEGLGFEAIPDAAPAAGPTFEPAAAVVAAAQGAPAAAAAVALPEAPYSGWVVWTGLFPCTVLLALGGMMCFDLVRNMWGWQGTTAIDSGLLDFFKGLLF